MTNNWERNYFKQIYTSLKYQHPIEIKCRLSFCALKKTPNKSNTTYARFYHAEYVIRTYATHKKCMNVYLCVAMLMRCDEHAKWTYTYAHIYLCVSKMWCVFCVFAVCMDCFRIFTLFPTLATTTHKKKLPFVTGANGKVNMYYILFYSATLWRECFSVGASR